MATGRWCASAEAVRAIDSGEWHEVTEEAYRAFLAGHPVRDKLRACDSDEFANWVYVYDAEAFAASGRHAKAPSDFKVAYRVMHEGRWRFWIPTSAVPEDQRRFRQRDG